MKQKTLTLMLAALTCTALHAQQKTLKETLGQHFLIGCAVSTSQVSGQDATGHQLVPQQFNSIVAENCMKGEEIHPEQNRYFWDDADAFVNYGHQNNMAVIGHCLVWHSQPPKWMFTDKQGNFVSRDTLIQRMKDHIFHVAKRYKGKIKGWDVVNEMIEDDGSFRKSHYYNIIGPEYIELAFKFAHQADPDAELYLNDFSMSKPAKRQAYCQLIRKLKAAGCRVDAIGMQSHNGIDYPDLADYEASIDSFAACGVKVMITELDLNMLPNPKSFGGAEISQKYEYEARMNPYPQKLDKKGEKTFNQRYLDFFKIYKKHAAQISRVTLWGVADHNSWLNDWPIKGRKNYPLLFDRNYQLKKTTKKIIKLFK